MEVMGTSATSRVMSWHTTAFYERITACAITKTTTRLLKCCSRKGWINTTHTYINKILLRHSTVWYLAVSLQFPSQPLKVAVTSTDAWLFHFENWQIGLNTHTHSRTEMTQHLPSNIHTSLDRTLLSTVCLSNVCIVSDKTKAPSEKSSIMTNMIRSGLRAFQWAEDEQCTLPLTPQFTVEILIHQVAPLYVPAEFAIRTHTTITCLTLTCFQTVCHLHVRCALAVRSSGPTCFGFSHGSKLTVRLGLHSELGIALAQGLGGGVGN